MLKETRKDDKPLKYDPEAQKLPRTSDFNHSRNELIKLLDNLSLMKENKKQLDTNINKDKIHCGKVKENLLIFQCIKVKQETTTTTKNENNKSNKNITEKVNNTVKPFSFDLRNKCKQQQQQQQLQQKVEYIDIRFVYCFQKFFF
ncbi:hypothetical protein M0802_015910 [Mischocyttarus mexicanus]|nr:hypothetical protein M0802_015910 [Mischocyttarus mexicanus]